MTVDSDRWKAAMKRIAELEERDDILSRIEREQLKREIEAPFPKPPSSQKKREMSPEKPVINS